MIAAIRNLESKIQEPPWHAAFLAMVPAIRRQAQITFRKVRPELREELIQAVIANCLATYARLIELGKEELAFPSVLARFAISQVRTGRQIGNHLRIRDVLSEYAQRQKGFQVQRLDYFDEEENCWQEIVVEDKRATPADIAACRIDFAEWLRQLPTRLREIARMLAQGETTSATARIFGVTAARISQLRLWLRENWAAFQGEAKTEEQTRLAVA